MNKKILIPIIVIVIVIAVGVITAVFLNTRKESASVPAENPVTEINQPQVKEDSTTAINQALESIKDIDLDKELQTIDADLKNL